MIGDDLAVALSQHPQVQHNRLGLACIGEAVLHPPTLVSRVTDVSGEVQMDEKAGKAVGQVACEWQYMFVPGADACSGYHMKNEMVVSCVCREKCYGRIQRRFLGDVGDVWREDCKVSCRPVEIAWLHGKS